MNLTRLLARTGSSGELSRAHRVVPTNSQTPVENCRVGDFAPAYPREARAELQTRSGRVGCSIDPDSLMHSKWKGPLSAHLGQSRLRLLAAPSMRHDTSQRRLISSRELRIVKFRFIFPQSGSPNCSDDYAPLVKLFRHSLTSHFASLYGRLVVRTIKQEFFYITAIMMKALPPKARSLL